MTNPYNNAAQSNTASSHTDASSSTSRQKHVPPPPRASQPLVDASSDRGLDHARANMDDGILPFQETKETSAVMHHCSPRHTTSDQSKGVSVNEGEPNHTGFPHDPSSQKQTDYSVPCCDYHEFPCQVLTCHQGHKFYNCSLVDQTKQCDSFQWVDEYKGSGGLFGSNCGNAHEGNSSPFREQIVQPKATTKQVAVKSTSRKAPCKQLTEASLPPQELPSFPGAKRERVVARKCTGGKAPRKQLADSSWPQELPSYANAKRKQIARKTTGGKAPNKLADFPLSCEPVSDPIVSATHERKRTKQIAKKCTGGNAPKNQLFNKTEAPTICDLTGDSDDDQVLEPNHTSMFTATAALGMVSDEALLPSEMSKKLQVRIKQMVIDWAEEEDRIGNQIIFPDEVIKSLAHQCPLTRDELCMIDGLGKEWIKEYGQRIVAVIQRFIEEENMEQYVQYKTECQCI